MDPMPNKTPDDASLQSTKQMLDELDALMEKMLTLPVSDPDEAAAFPPPIVKEPALSATLALLKPSESSPVPASKKLTSKPSNQKSDDKAESGAKEAPWPFNPPHYLVPGNSTGAPLREPEHLTNEVVPASVLPKLEPLMQQIVEPSRPSLGTQWLYMPLVWVNLGFDGMTMVFGGAGSWHRAAGGGNHLVAEGLAGVELGSVVHIITV
jgi:hypothetical protein